MLARALRKQQAQTCIHKLQSVSGETVVQSSKIASSFRDYYAKLYNLDSETPTASTETRQHAIQKYLSSAGLPPLTEEQSSALETPITVAEIGATVESLPNGKSPGPDGFTKDYYKTFFSLLATPMCKYFNAIAGGVVIPSEALLAHITVIPMSTVPQSYRPISLLNLDIKLLAKILANRLKHIVPNIVHPDQTGFITGREARDNSLRAIQLIHWARTRPDPQPYLILSTDAEKAFDHVDWSYLTAVLTSLGLGPRMLTSILALYATPCAQVKVNGTLSSRFPIGNGTRQGCPLSPLLFALVLEPLLRSVRSNQNIKGLKVGNMEHKLSAYADDILFHLSDPLISLPNLMQELKIFGSISNFKINLSKSEILPICLSPQLTTNLQAASPFTWTSSHLKYLGIRLTDRFDTPYMNNYPQLLATVRDDLLRWTRTAYTWLGRVNIIKMNVLPHILFFLQMLPIPLPRIFFDQLAKMLSNFIWNSRKPRIALRLLNRPKRTGGLGIPHIKRYYRAVALQRILNWRFHTESKLWVNLEKCLAGRNLAYAPWLPPGV